MKHGGGSPVSKFVKRHAPVFLIDKQLLQISYLESYTTPMAL